MTLWRSIPRGEGVWCTVREQGYHTSAGMVYRVYRQSGYAAQWRTRSRTIRRGVRINPTAIQPHEVWCMDVAEDRLMTSRKMMALLVKDEATSFCLSTILRRSFKGSDVEAVLNELVAQHGTPKYIRSDNAGPFIAAIVQRWAKRHHITLAIIHPGKPW